MNKLLLALLLVSLPTFAKNPETTSDYYAASVRIYNLEQNSGGSGSIVKSYKNVSYVLTNKHVCRLIEPGGYVQSGNKMVEITHYKKFHLHDLCLIRVNDGLGVNLQVAQTLSKTSDAVKVSGHPNLLPHILTEGHLSENMEIELVIGMRECTAEDLKTDAIACAWFGGKPVIEKFDSQVVSNLIKPGSSGSGVFNSSGELTGVVFAGSGRDFSHGFIVPHLYLLYFMQNAPRFPWIKVGTPVDDQGMTGRIFNYEKCQTPELQLNKKLEKVKNFCKDIQDSFIWSK